MYRRFCVVYILTQFLSNRYQHVMVDGWWSKLVNVASGVPQGSVLGPLLFLRYTSEPFSILENKLIGYADDSTLIAVVPSTGVRVTVAESLNRYLGRVSDWCVLRGIKFNASKTKTMIQITPNAPQSPPLTINGTVMKDSDDLDILGVTFDSNVTFVKHLHSVTRAASQIHCTLRKSWRVVMIDRFLGNAFWILSCQFWSTVLQCDARLPIHTINYWFV